jgi:hypothetical protein
MFDRLFDQFRPMQNYWLKVVAYNHIDELNEELLVDSNDDLCKELAKKEDNLHSQKRMRCQ